MTPFCWKQRLLLYEHHSWQTYGVSPSTRCPAFCSKVTQHKPAMCGVDCSSRSLAGRGCSQYVAGCFKELTPTRAYVSSAPVQHGASCNATACVCSEQLSTSNALVVWIVAQNNSCHTGRCPLCLCRCNAVRYVFCPQQLSGSFTMNILAPVKCCSYGYAFFCSSWHSAPHSVLKSSTVLGPGCPLPAGFGLLGSFICSEVYCKIIDQAVLVYVSAKHAQMSIGTTRTREATWPCVSP